MNALTHNQEFAVVAEPVRWCILRTSNQNTLPLAKSLAASGFTVWTPIEERTVTVPRANVKRRLPFAMMPGYVFADASRLIELLAIANTPVKRHRDFRLVRQNDAPAMIPDALLAPVRSIERKRKPRGIVKAVPVGAKVRLTEGGFAGLDGTVESIRNKHAMVTFPGFPMPVQIGCWLLQELLDEQASVHVQGHLSERAA